MITNKVKKVYVTEVLAENFSLLESRNVTEQRPANDQALTADSNKIKRITLINLILLLHHSVVVRLTHS